MKKFIVEEEEKLRILNLHESLKESILNPPKSLLNENVGTALLQILRGFKTVIKQSGTLMSKLDDMARTFRNAGKYPGQVSSGEDLLDLFLAGRLSNTSATDDMATVLLSIFKTTDDISIIRALAKEMVDGDAIFRQGVLNGSINPQVAFGTIQGDEILDYAYRAYGRTNPFSPGGVYNPNTQFGNWNSNILPGFGQVPQVPPGYAVQKLKAKFAAQPRAAKLIANAEAEINKFIPQNMDEANQIVRDNEILINEMLKQRGLKEELWPEFKAALKKNWIAKGAMHFFIGLGISSLFMLLMKILGINGLTPLKLIADGLGLLEGYEAAKSALCKNGVEAFCGSSSPGGKTDDDILNPEAIK